jgi:fructose-1,6-bisphosphatase/inositol monophosphatase family enzyme
MAVSSSAFLDVIVPAVRQAAGIAKALEGRVSNRPKSDEPTPVKAAMTIADSAAQEAILVPLWEHFPETSLRAEEDTPCVSRFSAAGVDTVVVDPIDGTLHAYLEGQGPYAVMVGLARDDTYVASVVCLPREDVVFSQADSGQVLGSSGGEKPEPVSARRDGDVILVSQHIPVAVREFLSASGYEPRFGSGGAISVAPLIRGVAGGMRYSPGPEGVSVRGRIGLPIALGAGAKVSTLAGVFPKGLASPSDHLITAADDEVLAILREAFRCVPEMSGR